MAEITIEMVDDVMERLPRVSYKEAKEALISTEGNVLEAVILLDKENNFSISNIKKEGLDCISDKITTETDKLKEQSVKLIKSAKRVRFIVCDGDKTVLNIPLSLGLLGLSALPIPGVFCISAALLMKCTVKIADENSDDEVEFGVMTPEKMDMLREILTSSFAEAKKSLEGKKETDENEDDADITEELLEEDNSDEKDELLELEDK